MLKIGIVGATGYTGLELLRYLVDHPHFEVAFVSSRQFLGSSVSEVFPHLSEAYRSLVFENFDPDKLPQLDAWFLALPHGQTHCFLPKLLATGAKIVDLSADFRLASSQVYANYYGHHHQSPSLLEEAVYGIPEFYRSTIQKTSLCANPGCYPTATLLGLKPLMDKGWCLSTPIIDAKSGISGAGRSPKQSLLFCETSGDLSAYGTQGHRHLPEIEQILGVPVVFSPHLVPMKRGMLASIYVKIPSDVSLEDVYDLYDTCYNNECFVTLSKEDPHVKYVACTNHCRLTLRQVKDHLVIFSVIDNLGKGASGQAVQNMNVMFGMSDHAGLGHVPIWM